MADILNFPENKVVRIQPVYSDIIEKAQIKGLTNWSETVVEELAAVLFTEMASSGIETNGDAFRKDFSLVIDSLRATIYRTNKLEHHLHDFIDNSVTLTTDVDELDEMDIDVDLESYQEET